MNQASPDDAELLAAAYGSGRVTAPMRLLLDTWAALNAGAARDRAVANLVGGVLLERETAAALCEEALAKTLARLDEPEDERAAHPPSAAAQELLDLPEPVRSVAIAAAGGKGWRFGGIGVKKIPLTSQGEVKAELLRIDPGRGAPLHGHAGEEHTLVLTGAFEAGGRVYRRGDLCVAGPTIVHRPTAEPDEVCISLAVTDAPLQFTGALGLAQRMFRLN